MIEDFLKQFYRAISFQKNEEWDSQKFEELFLEQASLIEENEGRYAQQTVAQYIRQFQMIQREYPEFFMNGFYEKQLSYDVIETENAYLIASRYEKHYTKEADSVVEYGTNNLMLI